MFGKTLEFGNDFLIKTQNAKVIYIKKKIDRFDNVKTYYNEREVHKWNKKDK